MRSTFEQWAEDEGFDVSSDAFAPVFVYLCWKTDVLWEGWKDYTDNIQYNESPYKITEKQYEYWSYGWRAARESEYNANNP